MQAIINYITRGWDNEADHYHIPRIIKIMPPFFYELLGYILLIGIIASFLK